MRLLVRGGLLLVLALLAAWDPLRMRDPEVEAARRAVDDARFADGVAGFRRALALHPGEPQVEFDLGIALAGLATRATGAERERERERLEREAASCFRAATRLPAPHARADALYNLGTTLHRLGEFTGAAHALAAAVELVPAHADALYNLELTLRRLGEQPQGAGAGAVAGQDPASPPAVEAGGAAPTPTPTPTSAAGPASTGDLGRKLDELERRSRELQIGRHRGAATVTSPDGRDW